jgi:hypothetical protein
MKMRPPLENVTEMPRVAQKTGEIVPVQIHSEYRAIIRATKQDHEMLHLREDGEPWTYEGFKTAWQREMNLEKFARFREERIVFHGTRKNAVNNLLEVGCSEERVRGSPIVETKSRTGWFFPACSFHRSAKTGSEISPDGHLCRRILRFEISMLKDFPRMLTRPAN